MKLFCPRLPFSVLPLLVVLAGCSSTPSGIPVQLGGLRLQAWIDGEQARELISQLHHKDVAPGRDVVGEYVGKEGSATLYLSEFETTALSEDALARMNDAIATGNSPFLHLKDHSVSNRKVKMCVGMGQAHFFFADRYRLYWLSVDIPIAEATLNHLLLAITKDGQS